MSYYRGKWKGLVALGGIALALMPCLQQTHVICRLAGCFRPLLAARANDVVQRDANLDRCCGHRSDLPSETPPQDRGQNAPCSPHCWCCQPPEPRQAPRNTSETVKTHLVSVFASPQLTTIVANSVTSRDFQSLTTDLFLAGSSSEICARLCRFLT